MRAMGWRCGKCRITDRGEGTTLDLVEGRKFCERRDVGEGQIATRGRGEESCGIDSERTGGMEKIGRRVED